MPLLLENLTNILYNYYEWSTQSKTMTWKHLIVYSVLSICYSPASDSLFPIPPFLPTFIFSLFSVPSFFSFRYFYSLLYLQLDAFFFFTFPSIFPSIRFDFFSAQNLPDRVGENSESGPAHTSLAPYLKTL